MSLDSRDKGLFDLKKNLLTLQFYFLSFFMSLCLGFLPFTPTNIHYAVHSLHLCMPPSTISHFTSLA